MNSILSSVIGVESEKGPVVSRLILLVQAKQAVGGKILILSFLSIYIDLFIYLELKVKICERRVKNTYLANMPPSRKETSCRYGVITWTLQLVPFP